MHEQTLSFCPGCQKPVLWAVDAAGRSKPVDPTVDVFMVVDRYDFERRGNITIAHQMDKEAVTRFMVSHLAVCPNPETIRHQIDVKNVREKSVS